MPAESPQAFSSYAMRQDAIARLTNSALAGNGMRITFFAESTASVMRFEH